MSRHSSQFVALSFSRAPVAEGDHDHLQALAASSARKLERAALHRNLKKLVSSHFGHRFDVEDVGMGRYAHDLQDAPMEFAIIVSTVPGRHAVMVLKTSRRTPSTCLSLLLGELIVQHPIHQGPWSFESELNAYSPTSRVVIAPVQ